MPTHRVVEPDPAARSDQPPQHAAWYGPGGPARQVGAVSWLCHSWLPPAKLGDTCATASFEQRTMARLTACFGPASCRDPGERVRRFLEEAIELAQRGGCAAEDMHRLVEQVCRRPPGVMGQEVGGVLVTLAAVCVVHGVPMMASGEAELDRIGRETVLIQSKQAARRAAGDR